MIKCKGWRSRNNIRWHWSPSLDWDGAGGAKAGFQSKDNEFCFGHVKFEIPLEIYSRSLNIYNWNTGRDWDYIQRSNNLIICFLFHILSLNWNYFFIYLSQLDWEFPEASEEHVLFILLSHKMWASQGHTVCWRSTCWMNKWINIWMSLFSQHIKNAWQEQMWNKWLHTTCFCLCILMLI